MEDEAIWKRRFLIFSIVRISGLAIFIGGLGIAFADWIQAGGLPQLGIPLALLGLVEAVLAPRLLKRAWRV